ncbi:hypothetical protein GCM10009841_09810 [Microlunatus panaciterrae]|uniref:Uncharacterized protein n=1 Tax=Microlunatus panaciterrae TaxID=400768 RepID=A0ABS2RKJ8_9ACTN|nr:hypothetical protein [Microlunatus panaciterrae]MBM7799530.1 hypothetical protein [Microlunatus panaciterrae]
MQRMRINHREDDLENHDRGLDYDLPTDPAARCTQNKIATSQLALPESTCREVYATSGYAHSLTNLDQTSSSGTWCSATATTSRCPPSPATVRRIRAELRLCRLTGPGRGPSLADHPWESG